MKLNKAAIAPSETALFLLVSIFLWVAEVTSVSYYHSNLVLNFLCQSPTIPIYVRDVPWDCSAYVVCVRGRAVHSQCPNHKLFSGPGRGQKCLPDHLVDSDRCKGQMSKYIKQICHANPTARIPSPMSCSHYFDCTVRDGASIVGGPTQANGRANGRANGPTAPKVGKEFVEHLLECPYPQLFSPEAGQCQHHSFVSCREKFEPKAPCDYMQYLQLYNCAGYDCSACRSHHPSCLKRVDGVHPVPLRRNMMMKCQQERTVDLLICPPGYHYPDATSTHCVRETRRSRLRW